MKTTVFLGGGRITGALCAGLRLGGDDRAIVVYDRHPKKVRALRRESRVEIARDLASAMMGAEMLIVAVRPMSVKEMMAEVAACGAKPPRLCVSLAAGIPIRNLRAWLGGRVHWARAMPSSVCRIGRGFTPVSFEQPVTRSERAHVRKFFMQVGAVVELAERHFDAVTAASSPTHGYHALATLSREAEKVGLNRKTALTAAAHALADGVAYWRESGLELDELLREAATPGGIAAATMAAMDRSGYARAVGNGLKAGIARARKNARG